MGRLGIYLQGCVTGAVAILVAADVSSEDSKVRVWKDKLLTKIKRFNLISEE